MKKRPRIVVVGSIDDSTSAFDLGPNGLAISLTDRFGEAAALRDPAGCSATAVAEALA